MAQYSGIFTLSQQMQANAAGNWTTSTLQIGSPLGGGYYAGDISYSANGIATHRLIVSPKEFGERTGIAWSVVRGDIPPDLSDVNGEANSNALNSASYPAGQFCKSLTIGGYTDWYLPARWELDICYYSLKPTTYPNATTSGSVYLPPNQNPYSVPSRVGTPYTATVPAVTTSSNFLLIGAQAFQPVSYWTSTNSSTRILSQDFSTGQNSSWFSDRNDYSVRAIRKIPI